MRWEDVRMETMLEKTEMELDEESVEQVRKLFNDYVVNDLSEKLELAKQAIETSEKTQVEALLKTLEPDLKTTKSGLGAVLRALGEPKDPLANLQSKLDALGGRIEDDLDDCDLEGKLNTQNETLENCLTNHLGTLQNSLCSNLAENTSWLSEQSDAEQKAVLERLAALERQMLTKLDDGSSQLTEHFDNTEKELVEYRKMQQQLAVQKYKLLLGTSLAFGIVNFLGIIILLFLNFMP